MLLQPLARPSNSLVSSPPVAVTLTPLYFALIVTASCCFPACPRLGVGLIGTQRDPPEKPWNSFWFIFVVLCLLIASRIGPNQPVQYSPNRGVPQVLISLNTGGAAGRGIAAWGNAWHSTAAGGGGVSVRQPVLPTKGRFPVPPLNTVQGRKPKKGQRLGV